MSVREQIESLRSVSNPPLELVEFITILRPLYRFGGIGCGPGRTAVATIAAACDTRVT